MQEHGADIPLDADHLTAWPCLLRREWFVIWSLVSLLCYCTHLLCWYLLAFDEADK